MLKISRDSLCDLEREETKDGSVFLRQTFNPSTEAISILTDAVSPLKGNKSVDMSNAGGYTIIMGDDVMDEVSQVLGVATERVTSAEMSKLLALGRSYVSEICLAACRQDFLCLTC